MKKSSKFLFLSGLSFFALLISACSLFNGGGNGEGGDTSNTDDTNLPNPDLPDPEEADPEVTNIKLKYTTDFFMKVGEVLDFNASFDGISQLTDEQKGVAWTQTNSSVLRIDVNPTETRKCNFTALKEGTTKITATSTYNDGYSKSVNVTVIDESIYTYSFQVMTDSVKNKFNDSEAGTAKASGTASLNGYDWDFEFENPAIKVSGSQMLTFGKGDVSFGNIYFRYANPDNYKIRSIKVICSSAAPIESGSGQDTRYADYGSASIAIKIGEFEYVNNPHTPKHKTAQPLDVVTGGDLGADPKSGPVEIQFGPTYKHVGEETLGGAVYLKSVIIEYYRGPVTSLEVSNLTYNNGSGDVRYDSTYQFYRGTALNTKGVVVKAKYQERPTEEVDVTRFVSYSTPNLTNGKFNDDADGEQDVTASYTYASAPDVSSTVNDTYPITVAPAITSIEMSGSFVDSEYDDGELIDYDGKVITIAVEGNGSFKTYQLKDYDKNPFMDAFDASNVVKEATNALQVNGFSFYIKHVVSGINTKCEFAAGEIKVEVYTPKTYTKVTSVDDFGESGEYLITSIYQDDNTKMRVWNGDLDNDTVLKSKGVNYLDYSHSAAIGDSLVIPVHKVENARFIINKDSDDKVTIVLSNPNVSGDYYLTNNSTVEFKNTVNEPKQKFDVEFAANGDVRVWGVYTPTTPGSDPENREIVFNTYSTSNKFNFAKTSSNTIPVQIYKIS